MGKRTMDQIPEASKGAGITPLRWVTRIRWTPPDGSGWSVVTMDFPLLTEEPVSMITIGDFSAHQD